MKKSLFFICLTLALSSCSTSLYNWSKYQDASYSYYKNQTEESSEKLIKAYQTMIEKPTGIRKTVPPGIYAEYGYMLVNNGKVEEGISLLNKEIELYPESKTFVERIIRQFEK